MGNDQRNHDTWISELLIKCILTHLFFYIDTVLYYPYLPVSQICLFNVEW